MTNENLQQFTTKQLREREARIELLADTSEDTDEYCALLGKLMRIRTEIQRRGEQV